ncbi:hypothetical protein [Synechococcus phage Yong-M3-232]|nr:hypothetical protein [Synechococcus phage Yong-M3-232]
MGVMLRAGRYSRFPCCLKARPASWDLSAPPDLIGTRL